MPSMRIFNAFFCIGLPCYHSLQLEISRHLSRKDGSSLLKLFKLDDTEVANRGSRCLDGSSPGFYFASGSEGKWVFFLEGGSYCVNKADCFGSLPLHDWSDTIGAPPLQNYGDFANYNRVYLKNCDMGMFMGDRTDPVEYNGKKLYFQGARILKHVVDTLSSNYSMKEVLLAGGSGGGHSIFAAMEYFKKLLPDTVWKFRAAPINGWFVDNKDSALPSLMSLGNMGNVISEECSQAYGDGERWNCLYPVVAYRYMNAPVFLTQIFDYTFKWVHGDEFADAWTNCLSPDKDEPTSGACTSEGVSLLNYGMKNYTDHLSVFVPYSQNGNGGYVSTCANHIFYEDEGHFNNFANEGVTVGAAILKWWKSRIDAEPVWYLPCTLGDGSDPQCESSCAA